jgi:hypothetical protein
VRRTGERVEDLCRRINAQAGSRPKHTPDDPGWTLGPRLRYRGSLHADIWTGSAADLAERDAIAVYPTSGWWRENPSHDRASRQVRYSLIVSLRITENVDLYTPIRTQVTPEITIET